MNGLKKLFATVDMTEGRPWEKILIFTFPMLLGNIAQQLYNTVDSVVVGKYIGDNALAAVGSAGPIFNLLLVLFVGISTGAAIMVSQYFWGKEARRVIYYHWKFHCTDCNCFGSYHDCSDNSSQTSSDIVKDT